MSNSFGGRRRSYWANYRPVEKRPKLVHSNTENRSRDNNWGLADPERQLSAIAKVSFEKSRILNTSEYRVLVALEKIIEEVGQGHRVMAQTSLGELIKPRNNSGDWKERKDAFSSINSKRLDFAVVDKFGLLALAVEYQGSGHYHTSAFMRDAVKREALRRANVPFIEVKKGTTPSELRDMVFKEINASDAA